MIIKSTNVRTASKSRAIVHHLVGKTDENDSIEVLFGNRGDVDDAFTNAELSNKKYGVKHFIISNLEEMTDEQFNQAINEIGAEFGFTKDNIKLAVIHGKDHHHADGRHCHFLVETINPSNNRNFDFKNYQQRQELVARTLEMDNGFQLTKGRHNKYVYSRLSESNPQYAERMKPLTEGRLERKTISEKGIEKLRRRGLNPFEIRKELKDIWKETQDYNEFKEHLQDKGYIIEQGRKTLIINDQNGNFITGVKNVLSVNDKELSQIIAKSEHLENKTASHGIEGPEALHTTLGGITDVTPSKTSEQAQEQHQEQTTQQPQTAPQSPEIGSNTETSQEIKAEASEGMSREEKLAVNEFNKEQDEKEKLLKESLANQKKFAQQMLDDMKKNKKPELKPSWTDTLDDREKLLVDIIDQPHPKLKTITDKQVRNFLYKNFKDELDEFYNNRKEYLSLRKEIKELQQKDKWYHFMDKSKLSKKEKEKIKKLMLMAVYLVHCMMNKIGLNNIKPNPYDYLTDEQKREYELQYKKDKLAQKLLQNSDRAKCLDSIAVLKVFENDSELMKWKNRDEVIHAKLAMQKLSIVRDINIYSLDQQGQDEFKKAQESLDIEKARKAVLDAHKREENRYLLDVRPEPENEQNQEKNNPNVIEFPKNSNVKKKKTFSYSR